MYVRYVNLHQIRLDCHGILTQHWWWEFTFRIKTARYQDNFGKWKKANDFASGTSPLTVLNKERASGSEKWSQWQVGVKSLWAQITSFKYSSIQCDAQIINYGPILSNIPCCAHRFSVRSNQDVLASSSLKTVVHKSKGDITVDLHSQSPNRKTSMSNFFLVDSSGAVDDPWRLRPPLSHHYFMSCGL